MIYHQNTDKIKCSLSSMFISYNQENVQILRKKAESIENYDFMLQVASEAVDKIRTLASLTKESYFLDKYMSSFDSVKKYAIYFRFKMYQLA